MASLNQLVSEIVHSVGQPNNYALRTNVKALIIHTRNELIRHSMEQHGYVDSVVQQKYKVSLIDVPDDDTEVFGESGDDEFKTMIKRTTQKVPRPVRLTNNLPFTRVSTCGFKFNQEIPYIKETTARFRSHVPGLKGCAAYDYINDYLYIFPTEGLPAAVERMNNIIIEAAFEHPTEVKILSGEGNEYDFTNDDDEWFIPEDMIGQLKDIIIKRDLLSNHRETDEIPNTIKMN